MAIKHIITSAPDDWWDDMSAKQKREYIKDHPGSKYAKQTVNDTKNKNSNKQTGPTKKGPASVFDKPNFKKLKNIDGIPDKEQVVKLKNLKTYLEGVKNRGGETDNDLSFINKKLKEAKDNKSVDQKSSLWLKNAKSARSRGDLEKEADHIEKYLKAKSKENPANAVKYKELLTKFNKRWNSGMSHDDMYDEFEKMENIK